MTLLGKGGKRRALIAAAAGAIAVGAAGFTLGALKPPPSRAMLQCEICQATFEQAVGRSSRFPAPCVKCGERAAWPAASLVCSKCAHRFPAVLNEERLKRGEYPPCPRCGSRSVSVLP